MSVVMRIARIGTVVIALLLIGAFVWHRSFDSRRRAVIFVSSKSGAVVQSGKVLPSDAASSQPVSQSTSGRLYILLNSKFGSIVASEDIPRNATALPAIDTQPANEPFSYKLLNDINATQPATQPGKSHDIQSSLKSAVTQPRSIWADPSANFIHWSSKAGPVVTGDDVQPSLPSSTQP